LSNNIPRKQLEINMTDIIDAEITRAINSLTNNKAPGVDEISAELLKHGNDVITEQLVVLLNSIWRDVEVPDAWKKESL